MIDKIRILHLEDVPTDAELIQDNLKKEPFEFVFKTVDTKKDFVKELNDYNPDLVLSDYKLPDINGKIALEIVTKSDSKLPVIIVTGTLDEETTVELMKTGAADYVLKENLTRLWPAVKNALEKKRIKEEKAQAEKQMLMANERMEYLLFSTSAIIYSAKADSNYAFTFISDNIFQMTRFSAKETMSNPAFWMEHIHSEDRKRIIEESGIILEQGKVTHEYRFRRKDESYIWLRDEKKLILDLNDEPLEIIGHIVNITDRKIAEQELQKSEELYRNVVASMAEGIVVQAADGAIKTCNKRGEEILGLTREQMMGKTSAEPSWQAIHEDGTAFPGETHPAMVTLKTGKPCSNVIMGSRKPDGSFIWISINSQPIFETSKIKPSAVVTSFQDITDRILAEEKNKMLAHAMMNINDCVSITDTKDNIIFVNDAFLKTYGYKKDEIIGNPITLFRSPNNPPEVVKEILPATLRGGWKGELLNKKKDGSEFPIALSTSIIKDEQGKLKALTAVAEDITERKRAEAILRESEQRFRSAFEDAGTGMALVSPEGKFLKVNKVLCKIVGYSVSELLALTFQEITHPADLAEDLSYVRKMLSGEIAQYHIEKRYFHKKGHIVWIILSVSLVHDDQGKPLYFVAQIQDINERKLTEEEIRNLNQNLELRVKERTSELHNTQKRLEFLLTSAPVVIYTSAAEPPFGATYIGNNIKTMTGYTPNQFLEDPNFWASKIHPDDAQRVFKELPHLFEIGHHSHEYRFMFNDGTYRWMHDDLIVVQDNKGNPTELLGSWIDITDRKRFELEILKAREIAESATRVKSEFLANMSHEIRTPMNAVLGLNHLMQKTELDDKQQDYIAKQEKSAENLLRIINDILDFSKIESGKLTIENTDFDMNDVLANIYDTVRITAREKKLELIVNMDMDVPNYLNGDPLRLNQVLLNFMDNAIKFTKKGEVNLKIELVKETAKDTQLNFSISDTGIGMTKAQVTNLFAPFTQADSSTVRKYGGTGLGLSISKRLVELMGGQIGVASKYRHGSTFNFTLPFKKLNKKTQERRIIPEIINKLHVLIVDDNFEARQVFSEYLKKFGFSSHAVEDGQEAIQELEHSLSAGPKGYDLIIMDQMMQGMNGEATIRKIVKKDLFDLGRIIISSGYIDDFHLANYNKLGVKNILNKPVTMSDLYNCIINIFVPDKKEIKLPKPSVKSCDFRGSGRILLVEDQEINQLVARDIMTGEGLEVDIADNGKIALDKVTKESYDVVLMDLQMPVMDGFEATRRIRKLKNSEDVSIIAMTANVLDGVKEQCLEVGMNDFIRKPIDPEELFSTLDKWLPRNNQPAKKKIASKRKKSIIGKDVDFSIIAGLNVQKGIERFNGNLDAYSNVLIKFRKNNLNTLDKIKNTIKNNQIAETQNLVHAIKGVSGNISAENLFMISSTLDDILKNNEIGKIDDNMINFEKELLNLLDGIASFEKKPKKRGPLKKPKEPIAKVDINLELKELLPIIKELQQFLNENNMKAREIVDSFKNKAPSAPLLELTQKISDCLDNYDFDKGYHILVAFNEKYDL